MSFVEFTAIFCFVCFALANGTDFATAEILDDLLGLFTSLRRREVSC